MVGDQFDHSLGKLPEIQASAANRVGLHRYDNLMNLDVNNLHGFATHGNFRANCPLFSRPTSNLVRTRLAATSNP